VNCYLKREQEVVRPVLIVGDGGMVIWRLLASIRRSGRSIPTIGTTLVMGPWYHGEGIPVMGTPCTISHG